MIQRIQTIYLLVSIICLSIVTFGSTLFSYVNETSKFEFSSYGILERSLESGEMISMNSYPMYISTISLILLCVLTMFSFKNLKRQYKLGRTTFYIYFLLLVILLVMAYFGKGLLNAEVDKRELGFGFILFVVGFPFVFLANVGIKRDKNLIDSLNRLR